MYRLTRKLLSKAQFQSAFIDVADAHGRGLAVASSQMSAIKSLRERTNAPISDVKSALVEAEWDLEGAYKTLRKKGVAAASKKASRHAAEGLIGIAHEPGIAALVEVNSETDFATKTEQFRNMVSTVASAALTAEASETGSIDSRTLSASSSASGTSVSDAVSECAGSVLENIQMRRAHRIACPSGVIASYLHASPSPGLGKMGAVVALVDKQGKLEGAAADKAHELGSKIAMHIVAARPLSLDRHSLPSEALEAEKAVLVEQARKSGKPANIIERMVAGRMHKFYEDSCLLDQKYVLDETRKIGQVVADTGRAIGADLHIQEFVRFQCGEGLEKEQSNFAEDVSQALQQTA